MTSVLDDYVLNSSVSSNLIVDIGDVFGLLFVGGGSSTGVIDAVLVFGVKAAFGRLQVVPLRWKFGLEKYGSNVLFIGNMCGSLVQLIADCTM